MPQISIKNIVYRFIMHHPDQLIYLFNQCFLQSHQTQLAYGKDEPLYQPAKQHQDYHTIYFAHGFYSSALHECAHWMLAGKARRQLVDYGYWYEPDGRSVEQQLLFQYVEVKPQALEWIFSQAAKYKFQFSFDNLGGEIGNDIEFQTAITQQMIIYQREGLPLRAKIFYDALVDYYR